MKRVNQVNKAPYVTTGNVFDDLGFSPEETLTLKIKSELWRSIIDRIESCEYTQEDLVRRLKVHQPDVSNILNGKISKFSISKLIQFAARLNLQPEITVTLPENGTAKRSTPVGRRRLVQA
jgi:predicted XRE-type DNA-binding protein